MESRHTQGTPRLSMTFLATDVLPLALPPARPITNALACSPSTLYQGGRPGGGGGREGEREGGREGREGGREGEVREGGVRECGEGGREGGREGGNRDVEGERKHKEPDE